MSKCIHLIITNMFSNFKLDLKSVKMLLIKRNVANILGDFISFTCHGFNNNSLSKINNPVYLFYSVKWAAEHNLFNCLVFWVFFIKMSRLIKNPKSFLTPCCPTAALLTLFVSLLISASRYLFSTYRKWLSGHCCGQ